MINPDNRFRKTAKGFEKCGNMDDLRNILPHYEKFMSKQVGELGAKVYLAELKTLLG